MGEMCLGCSPRSADGSCPDAKPSGACDCYKEGFRDGMNEFKECYEEQPPKPEQEPVADALHFAHWTTDKKDLSDYILVGSLTLAGIEDGEYGTSEIDPLDSTIDALQERLVTGSDHKKVPLLAYIGELKPTPPQRKPLSDKELFKIWLSTPAETEDRFAFARAVEAAHGIKE